MSVYLTEEKIQIIKWSYNGKSTRKICELFRRNYENRPVPNQSTISRIIRNFEQSGCVNYQHCNRGKRQLKEHNVTDILARIALEPTSSARQIASESGISKTTILKVLKRNKFKSYKAQEHQQLLPTDANARNVFCESIMERCNQQENFPYLVCFTDECTFHMVSKHNKQIHRHWATENPNIVVQCRTQYPQKVNVWTGILKNKIVGPIFIEGNLNSEKYLELLQNEIAEKIVQIAGEDQIWYLHDVVQRITATL